MQYRPVPGTDLSLSLLAFGNFIFGTNWWGEFSDQQGVALQNFAFDRGVTFFDTAPAYGNGRAESLMAQTIKYAGRDNLVLSTKFGYDFYADPGEEGGHRERRQDFTAAFLREDLERSLQRLGTDVVDLYQAHNLKWPQFTDEMFEALESLKDEGKIRAWGVALGPAIGWREEGLAAFTEHDAATVQSVYNLYEQDPGAALGELARQRGRGGVIARVPTNSGILDEEFTSPEHTFAPHDHRKFRDRDWLVFGLKKNEVIRPLAQKLGLSIRALATRWLASQPGMVSIEPNLLCEDDVRQFADACDAEPLPPGVLDALDALYAGDFGLGPRAHPCDLKSSTTESGKTPSAHQPAAGHPA